MVIFGVWVPTGLGRLQRRVFARDAQPFCVTERRRRTSLAVLLS